MTGRWRNGALVVVALTVAACGGDEGGAPDAAASASTRTPTSASAGTRGDATATTAAPEPAVEEAEQKVAAGSGVLLHVETVGPAASDAATVTVVVHGGPGLGLEAAAPFRQMATPDRLVVLYDQRGAGRSTAPDDGDFGLDAQIADLDAVRRAVGAEEIDLVGESFGGVIAAGYAAAHPDRVAHLVLLSAVPLDRAVADAGLALATARLAELQAEGLIPAELPPNEGDSCLPVVDAMAPLYVADPASAAPVDVGSCSVATSALTQQQVLEPARLAEAAEQLAGYTGPALVIMGDRDPFGLESLDRAVELLPSAQVERVVLDGVGHRTTIEAPERLFAELEAFVG